jgi:dTDP-4-dehydrorhamnose reductase
MLVRRWSEQSSFVLFGAVRRGVAPELGGKLKAVLNGLDATAFCKAEQSRLADFIRENEISVLVNCIGVIKQRAGGQDPVETTAVNALFPHQLAQVCSATGARLIHVSTDCVFSGDKGQYGETDTPDAQDFYGRSKALGEVAAPHLTLRTSIIGPELSSGEGLGLLEWLLHQKGPIVPGYSRAVFSGVTTLTLADLIANIVVGQPEMAGLFHVASEPIDKFSLLSKINRIFGLGLEVVADSALRIDRSLDASKIKAFMGYTPPSWDDQLTALARLRDDQA